jgi:putative DNA primase/helicase
MSERDNIRAALCFIPAYDHDIWLRIGMAIKSALGDEGYSLWAECSEQDPSWNERDGRDVWRSIKPNGKVTIGMLCHEAKKRGFKFNGQNQPSVATPEEQTKRRCAIEQTQANEAIQEQQRA